jgi:hypothetical protein
MDPALRKQFGALRANTLNHAYVGAEAHRYWHLLYIIAAGNSRAERNLHPCHPYH